ncbi:MAG: secretion protein HlyD, partial [Planctomycetaceae bacterium]|nr:secretion protein HlyD [Planctomycetaceae bacterium]
LILLLAAAGGGFYAYTSWEKKQEAKQMEYLQLFGNVEIRRVNLGFRVSGRIEKINFEEGDFVEKGQIIAQLDKRPYAESQAAAQAQLDKAAVQYEQMKNGSRPQEIEQARAGLDEAKAGLKLAEVELGRAGKLLSEKAIAQGDFDIAQTKYDEANAKVRLATQKLDLLIEGFRKEEIAAAKAQLAEAQANLDKTKTALEDTELCCPNDGIILTRIEEEGAVVQAGQLVATLSLKDAVWIYVYVPEPDLGKVFPAMKAEIYTDSRPNEPYLGQVGYISPEAEFTPKNVETPQLRTDLVYRLRVIADNPDNGLRQGMPVTVRLLYDK